MAKELLTTFCILIQVVCAETLGCFKCTSRNYDNPQCDDTFMNSNSSFYQADCMATLGTRNGLFMATQCVKIVVDDEKNGQYYLLRDCVVDNGGYTSETEIGRLSHCSSLGTTIELGGIKSKGCVEVCNTDGCNRGQSQLSDGFLQLVLVMTGCIFFFIHVF